MMGREFASASARWCHLLDMQLRPELVAICSRNPTPDKTSWYTNNFPAIKQVTNDYHELLANPDVEAVYCAVPHNLHQLLYCDIIRAGKHLLAEKPFGIDLAANEAILDTMAQNPDCLVRVASQYIYYPAAQHILQMIQDKAFGRIIEVDSGFCHCSDLDPNKKINWKRMIEYNGAYGSMGDLGVHIALVCGRAGWELLNTRAICSNIRPYRPDANGKMVPCETLDNANLLTELCDPDTQSTFPWRLRVHRIMPGEKNSWYIGVYGDKACARFSLKNPRLLEVLHYEGGSQAWQQIDTGFETAYPTVTGAIFEFGAPDAFMQMMAAFLHELHTGKPLSKAAACPSPDETHWTHRLFSAALQSSDQGATVRF